MPVTEPVDLLIIGGGTAGIITATTAGGLGTTVVLVGFTHLVLGPSGRVLGATIVAPRAGEMLAELAGVVARGGRLREVSSVVHPYPTWADGVWNAALAEVRDAMAAPAKRRAIRLLRRWRRATSRS